MAETETKPKRRRRRKVEMVLPNADDVYRETTKLIEDTMQNHLRGIAEKIEEAKQKGEYRIWVHTPKNSFLHDHLGLFIQILKDHKYQVTDHSSEPSDPRGTNGDQEPQIVISWDKPKT